MDARARRLGMESRARRRPCIRNGWTRARVFRTIEPAHGAVTVLHGSDAQGIAGGAHHRRAVDGVRGGSGVRRVVRGAAVAVQRAAAETGDARVSFVRSCRSAWVDFHVGYMLLVPAGAYGGDGSSWWVMTGARGVDGGALVGGGETEPRVSVFTTRVRRRVRRRGISDAVDVGVDDAREGVGGAARGRGDRIGVGTVRDGDGRTPFISRLRASLPRAIARAWTNTLDGDDDGAVAKDAKDDGAPKTPEELAKEKRKKRVNLLCGLAAFGRHDGDGIRRPLFILFAFQLFKVDPEELMNAVINKGSPERIEMETKDCG